RTVSTCLLGRVIHVSGVPPPTITLGFGRVIYVSGVPPPTITLGFGRVIHVSGVPPPTITLGFGRVIHVSGVPPPTITLQALQPAGRATHSRSPRQHARHRVRRLPRLSRNRPQPAPCGSSHARGRARTPHAPAQRRTSRRLPFPPPAHLAIRPRRSLRQFPGTARRSSRWHRAAPTGPTTTRHGSRCPPVIRLLPRTTCGPAGNDSSCPHRAAHDRSARSMRHPAGPPRYGRRR